jgi:hypothetical protein
MPMQKLQINVFPGRNFCHDCEIATIHFSELQR